MTTAGFYRGRHYTAWVDEVRRLKREQQYGPAEQLLLGLIAATEAEATANHWPSPAPWYTENLAIVYRKQKRYEDEVAILERYMNFAGNLDVPGFADRAEKARKLAMAARAASLQPWVCPNCGVVLEEMPRRSRKCPHCQQPIIVRTVDGNTLLMTEQQRDESGRQAARDAALAEARMVGATAEDFTVVERTLRSEMGAASPSDVFWRLANQQVMAYATAGDWVRAAQTYEAMARHLHHEGRDPASVQKLAINAYLQDAALHYPTDRVMVLVGCACAPCQQGPRKATLGELLQHCPIPHPDCAKGWCRCHLVNDWEQGPIEYRIDVCPWP